MFLDEALAARVNNLKEYYSELYRLQAEAHGADYMLVHDEIRERIQGYTSYTELGVNQGTTLAIPLLQNTPIVNGYDISLKPYNFAKHHFEQYATEHNIDFTAHEADTLKCVIEPTDVLYIDTVHQYNHLTKELIRHSEKAKKYIIFHDTIISQSKPNLKQAVLDFVKNNTMWGNSY
ncbi:MAG: hypothetical protein HC836_47545 [Richelia sp. RM2_1_2]|nr:hypothetical protein [Richelia sp. RM2_1_2]